MEKPTREEMIMMRHKIADMLGTVYVDNGKDGIRTCPDCGYTRQSETKAGNYEICMGCGVIIHVQPDMKFKVVKLADAPEDRREGLALLSGRDDI